MRYFLAGVMQTTLLEGVVSQDYRNVLRDFIKSVEPDADVYDPWLAHPDPASLEDNEEIRQVFEMNVQEAEKSDVVIAFIPTASMGTAIEIEHAWRAGKTVWTISPLVKNWVVRLYSHKLFPSIEAFKTFFEENHKQ
ncbi:hypothetical protein BLNAU_21772 [Blattamonas nauphoetae]|uniref:Nucleoside 2-deoxyribosyltransferase n=1 Tax=Blattamonas nauphoetae TaxID=2049346 RepID=A0ABQ9WUY2_9EUKA|nr:hypothetical protein BLNAU_21772 [Blattamonas nauphoetae]